jgi:hypothetical protein
MPESEREQVALARTNAGLLPGDELCEVTVQCSHILDVDSELARCSEQGGSSDRDVGAVSCLRAFAGERFSYATLDYDTGCRYEVVAGGKLRGDADKDALRTCAQAAVDIISTESLEAGKAKMASR